MSSYLSGPFVGQTPQQSKGIGQFIKDNPRMVAETAVDFSPAGDIKALTYDLPRAIKAGNKLDAGLASLAMLPFVPNLKPYMNMAGKPSDVVSAKMVAQSPNPEAAAKQLSLGQGNVASVVEAPISGNPRDRGLESARKAKGFKTYDEIRDMLGKEDPNLRLGGEEASNKLAHYTHQNFVEFPTSIAGFGPHLGPPEQGIMRSLALNPKRPTVITGAGDIPEVVGVEKPYFMSEYVMRMENPLFMEDVGGHSNPFALLDELMSNPQIPFNLQLEFGKIREDLLKQYARKVNNMRDIVRQTESGLYVPDFQTANIPGLERAIETGADLPEISIIDPNSRVFSSDFGARPADISSVFKPRESYDELGRDLSSLGRKVFTEAQRAGQRVNIQDTNRIRNMLRDRGFDSVVYRNTGEIPTQVMMRQRGILGDGIEIGADSYIPLDYEGGLKYRDAQFFDPTVPDLRYAKGGLVSH